MCLNCLSLITAWSKSSESSHSMSSLLPVASLILKGVHSPHPVFVLTYFVSGRERQRQGETKSWEQWSALRSPLAIINPVIDASFSTFPTLHGDEQRKFYLTFYYWFKVSMSKTCKPSLSVFFHHFAWVHISAHWPAESIDSHQYQMPLSVRVTQRTPSNILLRSWPSSSWINWPEMPPKICIKLPDAAGLQTTTWLLLRTMSPYDQSWPELA